MPNVLSVGGVVRFDAAFVEQMLTKLAARRPAAPSFCLFVRPASGSGDEQAVYTDFTSGTVERAGRAAAVTLRLGAADLEAALQGRISAEDFVRKVEVEAAPPSSLSLLLTALRPEAQAVAGAAREVAGEAMQELRYAGAGSDAMIDEKGRRVKGRPQAYKIKVAAAAPPPRAVMGAPRGGGDTHGFARDNLLRVLEPIAAFAGEQQADAFRVQAGMASVRAGSEWSELGRLGD